ncbi:DNA-binding NtrC family response regulator [Paucibacter oligotrophus]|uniref:DNA-binding NtrC family response regulator n=1 Tax=Roseateles oligotrophus TaxID=1769250 RepID=A0A840L9R5_9BURK|nr:response regulator [Roseateles oligotrophus]MBB4842938.1 DNA-binding NtrC family response regulator [Roseateles oligotrophus]
MATILVVDDELGIRALLSEILSDEGHTIELAENAAQARAVRERLRPDLVLLDIWMPDVDGVTLLKEWGGAGLLTMPVIMMSGHGTIDTAVEATKVGAIAFLEKPITLQKLLRAVEQALVKTAPRPAPAPLGAPLSYGGGRSEVGGLGGAVQYQPALPVNHGSALMAQPMLPQLGLASEQSFELDRPLREARDAFEKSYFEFHLAKENGSMTRVAEKTGLERTHLYRKLKQLGVDLSRNKRGTGL